MIAKVIDYVLYSSLGQAGIIVDGEPNGKLVAAHAVVIRVVPLPVVG